MFKVKCTQRTNVSSFSLQKLLIPKSVTMVEMVIGVYVYMDELLKLSMGNKAYQWWLGDEGMFECRESQYSLIQQICSEVSDLNYTSSLISCCFGINKVCINLLLCMFLKHIQFPQYKTVWYIFFFFWLIVQMFSQFYLCHLLVFLTRGNLGLMDQRAAVSF